MSRTCALVMLAITTFWSAACDDGDRAQPEAAPSTSSPGAPSPTTARGEESNVERELTELRHDGYVDLRLGMTAAQARSTGQLALLEETTPCREFALANYGDGGGPHGFIDARRGLSIVFGRYEMTTSEGVGVGATRRALRSAYPRLRQSRGLFVAPVSSSSEYFFRVGPDGRVDAFGVRLAQNRCMPPSAAW